MYAKSFDMNNVIRNTPRFIINKIIIIIFNCFKTMFTSLDCLPSISVLIVFPNK